MSSHPKHADPAHPIHELIAKRWSPYAYDPREVSDADLKSCLEAARWSASSYNEQPWSFIVARRQNEAEFNTMLDCLLEANQEWAKHAGVILLAVASQNFSRNGKPNRVAEHDIGLAAGNLSLQATALGLMVHQMAGINASKAKQTYGIPEQHDAITAIAIGYAAEAENAASEELAERDQKPRSRKSISEFTFAGSWDKPAF